MRASQLNNSPESIAFDKNIAETSLRAREVAESPQRVFHPNILLLVQDVCEVVKGIIVLQNIFDQNVIQEYASQELNSFLGYYDVLVGDQIDNERNQLGLLCIVVAANCTQELWDLCNLGHRSYTVL